MNILFLTVHGIKSLTERGIYTDLLRKFQAEGCVIHIVCPHERRERKSTELKKLDGVSLLRVQTLNIQKSSLLEKGLATLSIEFQYLFAIKKHFKTIKFDLILYSTPPITFSKVIEYIKKRDGAYSYLLLKDIFPQNAVDMNMIRESSLIHKIFKKKEKRLYQLSDKIGCLSEANLHYVLKHNKYLDAKKIEINPNSICPRFIGYSSAQKEKIRMKYVIPLDKKIFIYGGNLGKPQGLDFLLETILMTKSQEVFFLIIGSGTEYTRIETWFDKVQPENALLMTGLPKAEYDMLLASCDVGLIFLNKRFTIPNYPSRLLSYLEMKMPVIAATDVATDIGRHIEANKCGFSVISGESEQMQKAIKQTLFILETDTVKENAWSFLQREFTVDKSYDLIVRSLGMKV